MTRQTVAVAVERPIEMRYGDGAMEGARVDVDPVAGADQMPDAPGGLPPGRGDGHRPGMTVPADADLDAAVGRVRRHAAVAELDSDGDRRSGEGDRGHGDQEQR